MIRVEAVSVTYPGPHPGEARALEPTSLLRDAELLRGFRVEGFAPTTDAAYDILRETARVPNLDLGRMRG